jgi:cation:H+ antiporter
MAVSTMSAVKPDGADIALGNVVGSNILNVLFILGVSALVSPLTVAVQLVRLDVPIMIGVSLLAFGMAWDGAISRLDGLVLFAGAIAYTTFLVVQSRRESKRAQDEYAAEYGRAGERRGSMWVNVLLVVVGLALLVLGSRWLVEGAIAIARTLGVSELVIGLTIVAAGTSLPEVATSILASLRGERDIAVGNVVGSNIFNILAVLGLSAMVAPSGVPVPLAALDFDLPVMIAVAVACLPIFFTGHLIARWEGAVFLAYYAAYTAWLILASQQHDAIHGFGLAMRWVVLPLTALTLAVFAGREWRGRRRLSG